MKYAWNPYTTNIQTVIDEMITNGDFLSFEDWQAEWFKGREHIRELYQCLHGRNYKAFLVGVYYNVAKDKMQKLG